METIHLNFRDDCAVLTLNRAKANSINLPLVQELREVLVSLKEGTHIRGLVITGRSNVFSAGLDVKELHGRDEQQLAHFFQEFHHLALDLASFPKPLVAAINGHCLASGCVLALCCDYRVMASGDFRIGMNQVAAGVLPPAAAMPLAAHAIGHANAERMLLNGILMSGEQAVQTGLIDALAPQSDVVETAFSKLLEWLAHPDSVWRKTKERLRKPLIEALDMDPTEAVRDSVRVWLSQESRKALANFIEQLAKKS